MTNDLLWWCPNKTSESAENQIYHDQRSYLNEVNLLNQLTLLSFYSFILKPNQVYMTSFLKNHVNIAKFLGVIYNLKRFIKKTTGLVKTTNTNPTPPPMKKAIVTKI